MTRKVMIMQITTYNESSSTKKLPIINQIGIVGIVYSAQKFELKLEWSINKNQFLLIT